MLTRIVLTLCVVSALPVAQDTKPTSRPKTAREQKLQAVVDEMVGLVEKYAELKFPEPPRVRATKHREWREIVARELRLEKSRDIVEAAFSTMGLYLPATDEVVLSPVVIGPLTKKLRDDPSPRVLEALAHHKATIVHELVHALQQVHFELPAKLEAAEEIAEIQRFKYTIEGHAVLIEELVAEAELGVEDFMQKGPYTSFAGLGVDPSYATGRRYFLHVLRTEGMKGVHAKLQDPPTFEALEALAKKKLPEPKKNMSTSQPSSKPSKQG